MACRAAAERAVAHRKLGASRLLGRALPSRTLNNGRRHLSPYYGRCRSSPLCLVWECELGARMPFRRAEIMLTMFTHGVVVIEDITIARHMVVVGSMIGSLWLYRNLAEIAQLVTDRAT
jgi:hypothetical protein